MIYTIQDKSNKFVGFINAKDKDECLRKLKRIPFSCKIYKKPFTVNKKWKGNHRNLDMLRDKYGRKQTR